MKLPENKTGLAISAAGHAALLLWGLISFSAKPLEAKPTESMPVDIISAKDFSEIAKGVKDAKKVEAPKPVVEKVADQQKLVEEVKPKPIEKKQEVKTAAAAEPPPPAPEKPKEAKPEKAAEAKPEPKVEPKPDPIAEALKRDETKRKQAEAQAKAAEAKAKAAEAKAKAEAKRLENQASKFDASQIAALLDKRNPQRVASTGADYNPTPSLGAPSALALRMSQNELDAMRAKLMQLWSPPVGVQNPQDLVVRVRIQLGRDGKLSAVPKVVGGGGSGPMSEIARESAVRAVIRGQPYDMLTPANYEIWKEVEILFDPREMFRG